MATRTRRSTPGKPAEDLRFEATVQQGDRDTALARVADLDLDRVPDPRGELRLLVSAEELTRLLDEGYEVHLHGVVRPEPVPADLVAGDEEAQRWLEDRVEGIARESAEPEEES